MSDLVTVALGVSGISLAGIVALASRYGKLELKVDTLWEFQLRRGIVEGKMAEVLTQNSPVILRPALIAALESLAPELKAFYENGAYKLNEAQEAAEIERKFGARLMKEVCIPLGVLHGACIVGAMVYGRSLATNYQKKKSILSSSGSHKAAPSEERLKL